MPRQAPRLLRSALTGQVYVATRYSIHNDHTLIAHTKYDVTEDFESLVPDLVAFEQRVRELEAALEWAVEEGGWRLFYFAGLVPPIFDQSDYLNVRIRTADEMNALRAVLSSSPTEETK